MGVVIVIGKLVVDRRSFEEEAFIAVTCPYCKSEHYHPYNTAHGKFIETRVPHCAAKPGELSYRVTIGHAWNELHPNLPVKMSPAAPSEPTR